MHIYSCYTFYKLMPLFCLFKGIVSGVYHHPDGSHYEYIVDGQRFSGVSGEPVFDSTGCTIGMIVEYYQSCDPQTRQRSEPGLCVAIPLAPLQQAMDSLKAKQMELKFAPDQSTGVSGSPVNS